MTEPTTITDKELLSQCFYYINSFKRHRALAHIKRIEGKKDDANYHDLKTYQFMDTLELGLRAIQKGVRDLEELDGTDNTSA